MTIKNRYKKLKTGARIFLEAISYGMSVGYRYWIEPRYRRQTKNNKKNKEKYGSFVNNKIPLREAVIRRDGRWCKWCGRYLKYSEMTIDHILAVSNEGTNKLDNLQILCEDCHILKTKQERGDYNKMDYGIQTTYKSKRD